MRRFATLSRSKSATPCRSNSVKLFKRQSMSKFAIQFMIKFVRVHSHHMVYLAVELEVLLVEVETLVMVQSPDMELLLLLLVGK